MSAVVITRTTSRVMHLGIWALDRTSDGSYPTGRHVPICEQDKGNRWVIVATRSWTDGPIPAKPMCARCLATVDALAALGVSVGAR